MIEVQHLTKRYGRVTAVDDVSFRVERGEILGFLGPNGAGKTTTMRILTGYMPATEGKAIVAGFDVFDQPIEAKRRTGYLPETPPLYPDMTVARVPRRSSRRSRACPAPERQRARQGRHGAHADRRHGEAAQCGKLSKGYKQRVGLAQALIHNPDVLILDEPTAGLDPKQIIETRELVKELAGRSHHHPEHPHPARSLADLSARRHHQQGTRRGGRYARQPDGAAARVGNHVRPGRCGRRRRRRSPCTTIAGVTRVVEVGSARGPGRLRGRERAGSRHPSRAGARGRDERLGPARAAGRCA